MVDDLAAFSKLRKILAPFLDKGLDAQIELKVRLAESKDTLPCYATLYGCELKLVLCAEEQREKLNWHEISLFLPLSRARKSGETLSLTYGENTISLSPSDRHEPSNLIFERFTALVSKRSLSEEAPRLSPQQGYNCLSLRFYSGWGRERHLYCSLAASLITKSGPNRKCLPDLESLIAHGESTTVLYRINLELNKTPQMMSTVNSGICLIVQQMCEVIADLAKVGLVIQDFDPAEDTVMDNYTFQFISLSKVKLGSQDSEMEVYLRSIADIIKNWMSGFGSTVGRTSQISNFAISIKEMILKMYETTNQRSNFLFTTKQEHTSMPTGEAFVRESFCQIGKDSELLTHSIASMVHSEAIHAKMLNTDFDYGAIARDGGLSYAPDSKFKEAYLKNKIPLTHSTLEDLQADIYQADLDLLEDVGLLTLKMNMLNTSDLFKKTLSQLSTISKFKALTM